MLCITNSEMLHTWGLAFSNKSMSKVLSGNSVRSMATDSKELTVQVATYFQSLDTCLNVDFTVIQALASTVPQCPYDDALSPDHKYKT